jgi:probable rRNA maturation factor
MKANIEIRNLSRSAAKTALIKKAVRAVLEGEKKFQNDEVEISIVLAGTQKIKEINKKYRKIDLATDVLSFENDGAEDKNPVRLLGELMICPAVVKKDAKESQKSVDYQFAWVAIHGTLHLLGYDHEKDEAGALKMRKKEAEYLKQILNSNF